MQNSMVVFTFSVLDRKHPFWANLVQKIKIVRLNLNLVPKLTNLSDCNWTRTQNDLVRKRTLDHLAKLTHSGNYRVWIHSETRT